MNKEPIILAIESSCDDTAAAVALGTKILSNNIANQKIHEKFGGVVPELASRAHQQNIIPVIDTALKQAGINKMDIDAIAYTNGPGLLGSLLVGSSFAKSFALALEKPLIGINHMHGHVLSLFIDDENQKKPEFPFLCLTVSGGHTQFVLVNSPYDMKIIGSTIDDAAGEAFDKSAKLLGLPYPGGPSIQKYAELGNKNAFVFGRPVVKDLNFSFSGLKTSIKYKIEKEIKLDEKFIDKNLSDLCASIEHSIVSILINKLTKAIDKSKVKAFAIAGGVSANSLLRKEVHRLSMEKNISVHIPKFEYCTDNAAMIAIAGYYKFLKKDFTKHIIAPSARLKF